MKNRRTYCSVLCVAALLAAGCEEAVEPVLQTNRPFTIYGYLNPLADTQAVRLYTIDGVLERTTPDPVDAAVTITDLARGTATTLRDSIVVFPSGNVGHVFWANLRPEYDSRYRVEARRSDDATSTAETVVPPAATTEVGEADLTSFELPIPVLFRNAPNLIDIVVTYYSTGGIEEVSYGVEQTDVSEGRVVLVTFWADTRDLLLRAFFNGISDVQLNRIVVRAVVTSEEWTPPGGVFDPDLLVEPGTFSNVDNGFGFIGSGYPLAVEFLPSDAALSIAGFDVD